MTLVVQIIDFISTQKTRDGRKTQGSQTCSIRQPEAVRARIERGLDLAHWFKAPFKLYGAIETRDSSLYSSSPRLHCPFDNNDTCFFLVQCQN